MILLIIGLALTVVGWVIQLFRTVVKKDTKLSRVFLAIYALGCVLLSVGNFVGNDITGGILNAFDVILPVVLIVTLMGMKKTA